MWAVLAWLQILAAKNTDPAAPLVGVKEVCEAHWKEYGRNYYARYDYEGVDKPAAEKMMADMVEKQPSLIGTEHGGRRGGHLAPHLDQRRLHTGGQHEAQRPVGEAR